MHCLLAALFLTSAYPVMIAWWANRGTPLVHALNWTIAAWLAWFGALMTGPPADRWPAQYLALSLTSCAAVAVFGARRPIVGAWNFVLLGLLAVLLLPLAENLILGTPLLEPLRLVFISATIFVGVLNYLPTRFAVDALFVGGACVLELLSLMSNNAHGIGGASVFIPLLLALACWDAFFATWLVSRLRKDRSEFDKEWLSFRDRFGFLWSQRVREQFNTAAASAGWTVYLRWGGLKKTSREIQPSREEQEAMIALLQSTLKRFMPM